MAFETSVLVGVDSRGATSGAQNFRRATQQISGDAQRMVGDVDRSRSVFERMRSAVFSLKGAFAALGLAALGRAVIGTASEFEQLRVRLETVTGSAQRASTAFDLIKDFARTTPFEVTNITSAFIRLQAAGITPTRALLESFGNTAAAFGRDITQFADAVIGAVTGETDRLKQFGIIARVEGDKLRIIFRGQTQEISRDADTIVAKLAEIGNTEFAGGMERQVNTLEGAFSNLIDALDDFFDTLSNETGLIDGLTSAVRGMTAAVSFAADVIETTVVEQISRAEQNLGRLNEQLREQRRLEEEATRGGPGGLARERLGRRRAFGGAQLPPGRFALPEQRELSGTLEEQIARTRDATSALRAFESEQRRLKQAANDLAVQTERLAKAEQVRNDGLKLADQIIAEVNEHQAEFVERIDDQVRGLTNEQRVLRLTGRERAIEVELIKAENLARRAGTNLTREQIDQIKEETGALFDLNAEIKKRKELEKAVTRAAEEEARERQRLAEEETRLFLRPFENAIDSIQQTFTDMFRSVFDETENGFENLGRRIKSIFVNLAAEVATLLVFRPIVGGALSSVGLGQVGSILTGAPGSLSAGSSLGSLLGLGRPGMFGFGGIPTPPLVFTNFGISAALDSLGASLGFAPSVAGITSAGNVGLFTSEAALAGSGVGSGFLGTASLSQFLGGAGLGFGAGTLLNSLIGGNQTGGLIGSGVGALAGAAIGSIVPGIGTLIGGLIGGGGGGLFGGLFGNNRPSVGPLAAVNIGFSGGRAAVLSGGADNGGDLAAATRLGNQIANVINDVLESLGATGADPGGRRTEFIQTGMRRGQFTVNGSIFGTDANALAERATIAALRSGFVTGLSPLSQLALTNTRAGDLEGILADIEFARSIEGLGNELDPLASQLRDITTQFEEMRLRAEALGLPLENVVEAQERQVRALREQAGLDIRRRFDVLTDPLRALQTELDVGALGGVGVGDRLVRARELFSDVVERARGGDLGAILDFPGLARARLQLERDVFTSAAPFGAAVTETRSVLSELLGGIEDQRNALFAEFGIEISDSLSDQTATLSALLEESRDVLVQIRDTLEQAA